MTDDSPPTAIDSERAVLGSILMNRDAIIPIAAWLRPAMFYLEKHAWIYAAMLACYHARIPPDTRTIADALTQRGQLDAIGGILFLAELVDAVPTSAHVEYYARAVERASLLRGLIAAGATIAAIGYQADTDTETALADAHAALSRVVQAQADDPLQSIAQAADTRYEQVAAGVSPGIPSGFRDLDNLTGGLHRQDLILLAARPSIGKSALATTIAVQVAESANDGPVFIFSLEMSNTALLDRIAAARARLDLAAIRQMRLNDTQLGAYLEALGWAASLPIYINDHAALSVATMRGQALRALTQHGTPALIVVDYLQLMSAPRKDGNRVREIGEISRGLKALAKELNCPVLALSQLSRAIEGRTSHVPMLSDLRESGDLEQDADMVLFLYREEVYDRQTDKKGIAELHIAKQRQGPLGVVPLRFDAPTTAFQTFSYRTPDGYAPTPRGGYSEETWPNND